MKINVTVDLSEFYNENEEKSFSDQIKDSIVYKVKQSILTDLENKLGSEFNSIITQKIELEKEQLIQKKLDQLVTEAKVKKRYDSSEMISIEEWMKEELKRLYLSDRAINEGMRSYIRDKSNELSEEFKQRYDLAFASQIISKLSENGMLQENIADILLKK